MTNRFREIFFYSRRQRRALMLLCLLIVLMLGTLIYVRHFMPLAELDPAELQAFVEEWEREESILSQQNSKKDYPGFPFDPNTASDSVLRTLGFSARLSKTIVNYTSSGGQFRKADDLLRIYGMDTAFYREVRKWVSIDPDLRTPPNQLQVVQKLPISVSDTFELNSVTPAQLKSFGLSEAEVKGILGYRERFKPFESPEELYDVYNLDSQRVERLLPYARAGQELMGEPEAPLPFVEINSVDSLSLLGLKGIGPYFAGRIPGYRKQLGGYLSPEQLLEIPGMDTLRFQQLRPQLKVNTNLVRRMDINEATYEEMVRHPYIRSNVARNIIRFREEYRRFKSTDELMNLELIDGVLFSKIAGYLTVDEKTN